MLLVLMVNIIVGNILAAPIAFIAATLISMLMMPVISIEPSVSGIIPVLVAIVVTIVGGLLGVISVSILGGTVGEKILGLSAYREAAVHPSSRTTREGYDGSSSESDQDDEGHPYDPPFAASASD